MLTQTKETVRYLKMKHLGRYLKTKVKKQDGFWEYIVTVAIVLVVAAFIALPQLRTFATSAMVAMTTWFTTIKSSIFNTV